MSEAYKPKQFTFRSAIDRQWVWTLLTGYRIPRRANCYNLAKQTVMMQGLAPDQLEMAMQVVIEYCGGVGE